MKTFAIGDIHGCAAELKHLMFKLISEEALNPQEDTVVFLGDYVDRGRDTKGVITELMKYQRKYPHWVFLRGNHENLMLDALDNPNDADAYYLWWNQGGRETTRSYIKKAIISKYEMSLVAPKDVIPEKHINWIRELPYYYEDENAFYVHAGIPDAPLEEIKQLEAEDTGSMPNPIRQAMTWARYEFIESDYDWGKMIIFGHTPNQQRLGEPIVKKNKVGLDGAISPSTRKNLLCFELPAKVLHWQPAI